MKMASLTGLGMLFVRCGNGGQHHPAETTTARVFTDCLPSIQDP
jgi:hypothetical protein